MDSQRRSAGPRNSRGPGWAYRSVARSRHLKDDLSRSANLQYLRKTNVDQPWPTVVNIVQAQVIPALEDFGRRLIKNAKT